MTLIKLFREKSFQNVVSALNHSPRLLVYLISPDALKKCKKNIEAFFKNRGIDQKILWYSCNTDDLNCLQGTLEEIISDHNDCVADINEAEGLMLLAVGKMIQKHPEKLSILNTAFPAPALKVREMISLMGGSVESAQSPNLQVSQKLWQILKKAPDKYNRAITELNACIEKIASKRYRFKKPLSHYSEELINDLEKYSLCTKTENGLIMENDAFILKAGNALEARVLWAVKDLCDDAVMGALLDWDGVKLGNDTNNEIDVLLSNNSSLCFISCKNGSFDENELYKLCSVASRFGTDNSVKAVVATAMTKLGASARQRLEQRAKDMSVRLISEVHLMSDEELINAMKTLIPR